MTTSRNSATVSVPDAWDDDWEAIADKQENVTREPQGQAGEAKLTKAEVRRKHAEANRQLWESADAEPEKPIFLQARDNVPLATDFKPPVKLLSRKPKVLSRDAAASMAGLSLDGDDSEEEERKRIEQSFAERQAKAQKEREEKQRKYQEVREKIFGSSTPTSEESPGRSSAPNKHARGKGRGRAGRGSHPSSSADHSPARGAGKKELYDPSYAAKPNSAHLQKDGRPRSATPGVEQHIRAPRGPDGSGRGGFGFGSGNRGNRLG